MARVGLFFLTCIIISCSPSKRISKGLKATEKRLQNHIGLFVYSPEERETIIDYNAEKYFTPASNTKIFTLFSSLQIIGDSIPALRYVEKDDSLIFWGTGDPSFLYPEVYQNSRVYDFIRDQDTPLYFSASNFHDEHFGPGWAWDDYNYNYSPERSAFPIYGNMLTITDSIGELPMVSPAYFQDSISTSKTLQSKKKVTRQIANNSLMFYTAEDTSAFTKQIPFHVTTPLFANLLQDTLHLKVVLINKEISKEAKTIYSIPSDSLYKVMMQESDNFIAEQLLQVCAGMVSDTLNSEIAIEYVKKNYLFDLPDQPNWVDGSGLSRYNLFTPRMIVRLWEKILLLVPRERLFPLLAIGGKAGTIKNNYKSDTPYIFGKTGTLSNNHCLSGYLVTRKGKLLIFSFMNNNYTVPTSEIKKNMETVLFAIHEKY